MLAVSAAVGFLTRVPIRREVGASDVARGAVFFPVVGAAIGAVTGGVALLAHLALSPFLSAALAIAVATALTGALHLDGLADTADAFGGRTRERRLEIMRDSRIGTFGAAAVALDLLIKVGAVEELVSRGLLPALVAAGAVSRAASVLLAGWLPYARESGTGGVLGRPSRLALAVCLPAAPFALLFRGVFRRLFGGVTGDALGAAIEMTETLALVVAAAIA
jgi:adenosylcobinamide-GDP ribazoletransferase